MKSNCDAEVSRILHDAYNVTYVSGERTANDGNSGDDARKDALRNILGRQQSNDVTFSARPGAENRTITVASPGRLQVPAIPHELSERPGSVNVPQPGLPRDIISQSPIEVNNKPSPIVEVAAEQESQPEVDSRIVGSAGPERLPTILPELSERPRVATVSHPEPPLNNLPQNPVGIEVDDRTNSKSVIEAPERENHYLHAPPTPPEQRIPFIIHEDDGQERQQISSYDLAPPSIPVIREEEGPSPTIARETSAGSRASTTPFGMREGNVEVPPARRESEYYTPHNLLVVVSPIVDEAEEEIGYLLVHAPTPTAFEESDVPIFTADMAQRRQAFEELERTDRPSLFADMPQDNGLEGIVRNSSRKRNGIA